MTSIRQSMLSLLAAIRFLTIFPIMQGREFSAQELGRSSAWFPLVGLMLGGILVGLDVLLDSYLNGMILSMLLITVLVIMTGAFHLDGFIDTCDAMFLPRSPQEKLRIMSDSRVGSFGVVGACCLILLKFTALLVVPHDLRWGALLLMPVVGRWTMVLLLFAFPYAKKAGKGLLFRENVDSLRLVIASVVTLAAVAIVGGALGVAVMAGVGLVILLLAMYVNHGLNGLTGDSYGAANEVGEVILLILFPVIFDFTEGGLIL